jgi:hypothetical protein
MAVVDKKGDQASVVGGSGLPDFLHEDYFYRLADGRVYYGLAESYIYEWAIPNMPSGSIIYWSGEPYRTL